MSADLVKLLDRDLSRIRQLNRELEADPIAVSGLWRVERPKISFYERIWQEELVSTGTGLREMNRLYTPCDDTRLCRVSVELKADHLDLGFEDYEKIITDGEYYYRGGGAVIISNPSPELQSAQWREGSLGFALCRPKPIGEPPGTVYTVLGEYSMRKFFDYSGIQHILELRLSREEDELYNELRLIADENYGVW
jgi:hypothetical protein